MNRKASTSADIDWYLISIDRLKKIGLGLLALLILGGAAWWWFGGQNPRERARRAIREASSSLNQLASVDDLAAVRADFERARASLDEAQRQFGANNWDAAEKAAIEAAGTATMALARIPGETQWDAKFLTIEGDVQIQKGSSGQWRNANSRDPLMNGDWVRTGGDGSAELIFFNGSIYTIGANALLEIYATVNPATSKKQDTVQMQVGSLQVTTENESSTVQTPGSKVVVSSASTTHVGVSPQKETAVTTVRGSSAVAPAKGGEAVQLTAGKQVEATPGGDLSPVRDVAAPPALLNPTENQVFQAAPGRTIELVWETSPQAAAYQLQVSRSRLFSSLEIDARRTATSASARVTDEGSFYWRIASIDASGRRGPFSPFRRFRVVGGGTSSGGTAISDKTPPQLQLKRPFRIGGAYYLFEGKVEPGASVFLNDEELAVESDGSFKKLVSFSKVGWNTVIIRAVDPSANQTIKRENVYVEE
ncbi:MAG TPA: FecR domain-containing protein [Thermoanaerobaculia bacterium]